ncbi:MAG TPA: BACON domain-containing protein [Vicinamibacterales bacterium]|nr:BACON domain-containing protein [Vicinamibacterales bacterium]
MAANNTSSSRSGTLTIAGRTLTVAQSGNGCTYVLSPTSRSLAATAGSSSVLLTTGPQCPWTATASANWITVSNASGSSSGNVTYSVTANNSANARTATVTIASQVHTVTQAGSPPPSSPRGLRIVTAGGN